MNPNKIFVFSSRRKLDKSFICNSAKVLLFIKLCFSPADTKDKNYMRRIIYSQASLNIHYTYISESTFLMLNQSDLTICCTSKDLKAKSIIDIYKKGAIEKKVQLF